MAYSMYNKRGYFYDVRNLPYGYYGMHPMDVMEYQRGRPTKLPVRLLNRQFKQVAIPLGEDQKSLLTISVQPAKGKQQQPFLVLSSVSEDSEEEEVGAADCVSVPESLAPQLVQQLRKLIKWKPSTSANATQPSAGQGLVFEDSVFKAQIICLAGADAAAETVARQQYAIKVLTESRARDPQERRELSSVQLPMEPGNLAKLKAALADLLVTESPLYHTESLQGSDGSKFYLDLIREEAAHYLKVSHVTRDFRSIVIVPAGDVEALRDLLDTSLKAMKTQQPLTEEAGKLMGAAAAAAAAAGIKRKRGRNNQRRRPTGGKRGGGSGGVGGGGGGSDGKENSVGGSAESPAATDADAVAKQQPVESSEDNSTVESRPVENGDGSGGEKLSAC